MLRRLQKIRYLAGLLLCALPAFAVAEERVCKPVDGDGRNYEMRWEKGATLELRGRIYHGEAMHWPDGGGWRTASSFSWSAGFNEDGVHNFYVKETRYEFDPEHGEGGRLYQHIMTRRATPEAEARLRQKRYDHPFPGETPAQVPIRTSGFDPGTMHSVHVSDCVAVEDGSLKLSSDYSVFDIFMLYIRDALEAEKAETEAEN